MLRQACRTCFASAALLVAAQAAFAAEPTRKSYIVQLADKPAAAYTGGIQSLRATKPMAGKRLDPESSDVRAYVDFLEQRKAGVLRSLSGAAVTHQFNLVFNGFAAQLSDDEVRALKKNPAVARVSANVLMHTSTSYTPSFLGLDKPGGLWDQVGGKSGAGEDIIVAMLDTGVWPENPGFADRVDQDGKPVFEGGTLAYDAPPARWKGYCEPGQGFTTAHCNNKLIGARIFPPVDFPLSQWEYVSVRDSDGHGTHTATTAAGAGGVSAEVAQVPMGKITGMAPRARLAIYKVCWTANYGNGGYENACPTSSSVAAIEQAVRDGANVISFSIGDSAGGGTFDDPTEQAFLGAANAGVFVAAAAGNQGPEAERPAPATHLSPWLTTVANSTHNRSYSGDAILDNGTALTGRSTNAHTARAPLLLARDAGKRGTVPTDPRLAQCFGPTDAVGMPFDPDKVKGKIVVCDRGGNVLVNKVANLKLAGAAGVVIVNVEGGATTLPDQPYEMSMVHLDLASARKLKAYMATAGAAAYAALGNVKPVYNPDPAAAPIVAGGSSRGPNMADANVLKPDLAAPGTDILAGITPAMTEEQFMAPFTGGTLAPPAWRFASGTSMATPHVSGIAAVLKQLHPDWSPAAIKSALMTTAFATQRDSHDAAMPWDPTARDAGTLPWAQGAGQIAPSVAADPGLVYDLGADDYRRFLCGQTLDAPPDCTGVTPLPAQDLNLPSLTAEAVLGVATLHRRVTNVGPARATYTVSATLPGYRVDVQPATLTLAPGEQGAYTVRLTRTEAPLHAWRYGRLAWRDGSGHVVASPLTARAAILAAPAVVASEATSGSRATSVRAGYTGPLTTTRSSLQPALQTQATIGQARATPSCVTSNEGENVTPVTIAPGTLAARFALFNDDTGGADGNDLDLFVAKPDGTILAASEHSGSNEVLTLRHPAPGTYHVCVLGYALKDASVAYKLSSWLVTPGAPGAPLKVALPGVVYPNKPATVAYSWSGLEPGKRYLGMVSFLYGGANEAGTLVDVDTTDPLPSFGSGRQRSKAVR
jgi:subtilisin family serine protease